MKPEIRLLLLRSSLILGFIVWLDLFVGYEFFFSIDRVSCKHPDYTFSMQSNVIQEINQLYYSFGCTCHSEKIDYLVFEILEDLL